MKRFTRDSKFKRRFSHEVFDAKHRASVMVGRIHALGTELHGHLSRAHSDSVGGGDGGGVELEPVTVTTSCVINVCSSRKLVNKDEETEEEIGTGVKEPLGRIPSFYEHDLPAGLRFPYIVPRSRDDWMDFIVWLIKQRITFKYLTDQRLKRVIEIARGQIGRAPQAEVDPDIPDCYNWDEEQVGNWLEEIGYPQLQSVFRENFINGRRLLGVDASALNRMGIRDFQIIQELALNIRSIFGLSRPNGMRAILRNPPYETFLTKYRIHNGPTYDLFTFKKFCKKYHYDYEELIETKTRNANIPSACTILIRTQDVADTEDGSESSGRESLEDARSVEFQVRHQFIRNQTIETIINELIDLIFRSDKVSGAGSNPNIDQLMDKILNGALLDLGFGDPRQYTFERMKFAAQIALALLAELRNTTDVLSDINRLKTQLKMEVSKEEMADMRVVAGAFIEDLAPIAALLALNQLSLEAIFKHEPEFEHYVDSIVAEAEKLTNDAVPTATALVDSVLAEAQERVMAQVGFPYVSVRVGKTRAPSGSGLMPNEVTETPPGPHYDQSGHHLIYPVGVDTDVTGMRGISKGRTSKGLKGKGAESKKKLVTSVKKKVDGGGDATMVGTLLSSTSINLAKFWKQMEKKTLSPRMRGTGSLLSSRVEGPHILPQSSSRPQSAPVDREATKKGTRRPKLKTTKAKDIWDDVKLLRTVVKCVIGGEKRDKSGWKLTGN